jgi:hypothetical protein
MISIPKYITIDSFHADDLKDLFNAICTQVLMRNPLQIKREVLKVKGTDRDLENYKPTLPSLLTLIATYDLKFDFTVKYVEMVNADTEEPPREPVADTVKELEKQRKEILDPELQVKAPRVDVEKLVEEVKPVKEEDLPSFD